MRKLKTCPSNPALRTPAGALLLLLSLSVHAAAQSPTADSFNPGVASQGPLYVDSVAVQADGKILVGGLFDTLGGLGRTNIGRINRDGSVDLGFTASAGAEVWCLAVQADGKIVVGGQFLTLNGQPRASIGRLNADGTLDASFNPAAAADDTVICIVLQPDGKIVIGGVFYWLNGEVHESIGRLNADGTVDQDFQASASGGWSGPHVNSLALQPDGMILVGGEFFLLDDQLLSPPNIGRLLSGGMLDTTFYTADAAGGTYESVALQADGKVLVMSRSHLIQRLNADGQVDTGFSMPALYALGLAIAVQADEKILLGGSFDTLDGRGQTNLARLNTDGTLDTGFDAGTDGPAYSLALQSDGRIVAGGNLSTLAGQSRTNIGRLNATDPATQILAFDGSAITWMRGGTSPEVWRTTFDYLDGGSWSPLGEGGRVPDGWELSGLSLPTNATIRARGYTATGGKGDSFVETVLNPALAIADAHLSGGKFGFNALGPAGQAVTIEASPDLRTWLLLQTVSLGVGPFPFSDPQAASFPKRFYRLRAGP